MSKVIDVTDLNFEEEVLKSVLEHVLGDNKGLAITLHVRDITAGSGSGA